MRWMEGSYSGTFVWLVKWTWEKTLTVQDFITPSLGHFHAVTPSFEDEAAHIPGSGLVPINSYITGRNVPLYIYPVVRT